MSTVKCLKRQLRNKNFPIISDIINDEKVYAYEELATQKMTLAIYYATQLSFQEKDDIVQKISNKIDCNKIYFENNWKFVKNFFPISEFYLDEMRRKIKNNFNNSYFMLLNCLGYFVEKNPDVITLAKNIILNISSEVLYDDVTNKLNIMKSFKLTERAYENGYQIIEEVYNIAVKYGVIYEQYDMISYLRLNVVRIINVDGKPESFMKLNDEILSKRQAFGNEYDNFIVSTNRVDKSDIIFQHYKCRICRYCSLLNIDEESKEIGIIILERQFLIKKIFDQFFLLTGDIPSFIFSIVNYLYTELLILLLYTDDNISVINIESIKKNMIFSKTISNEIFEESLSLILEKSNAFNRIYNSKLPFVRIGRNIVLGRWMFDGNLFLIDIVKSTIFSGRKSIILGGVNEHFGKTVFENFIKNRFRELGWNVVMHSIKLKENKRIITDVDIIAERMGQVIVGQIKTANTTRDSFDMWKTSIIIDKGLKQANYAKNRLINDTVLLNSIFKSNNFEINYKENYNMDSFVIVGNNLFTKYNSKYDSYVIGFELLDEWLTYFTNLNEKVDFDSIRRKPYQMYNFDEYVEKKVSLIDNSDYKIEYEEFE